MSRALVIGYGSIGRRHSKLLREMGMDVAVVSRRTIDHEQTCPDLETALPQFAPSYIVICNETSLHLPTLQKINELGFAHGKVLVEKPLGVVGDSFDVSDDLAQRTWVAYQLRFDPLLQALKSKIAHENLYSLEVRACSYLPEWRPGRDYRRTESASRAHGGGVLYDLSHELDYLLYLIEDWSAVTAVGGKISELEIDADDAFLVTLRSMSGALCSVALNYFERREERWIIANTNAGTYKLDFVARTLTHNGTVLMQRTMKDFDDIYRLQHQDILENNGELSCGFAAGAKRLQLIESIQRANSTNSWIMK
jgi:predicted dehydrogenase